MSVGGRRRRSKLGETASEHRELVGEYRVNVIFAPRARWAFDYELHARRRQPAKIMMHSQRLRRSIHLQPACVTSR
jgi:hypothetical protein